MIQPNLRLGGNGRPGLRLLAAGMMLASLSACSSLGGSGPSGRDIRSASQSTVANAGIKIIDVTDAVARQVIATHRQALFSDTLGDAPLMGNTIGRGDVLEVTIWESPPAALFGGAASFGASDTSAVLSANSGNLQKTSLPEMMVDTAGRIRVPFAGSILAAGRSPQQVEREIISRLAGKAHDPQVIVGLVHNANANVTVVGDVSTNTRVSLTPRGERLLDVLASAGGVKQPISKMTIQVSRGGRVASMPLQAIIRDPAQNIRLSQDDIVTALFQPYSFVSLGASGKNEEIPFEGTGISLAQALGRIGGLREDRADVRGVFIFRFEEPAALDPSIAATARQTPDGLIPVIYRVDLKNPATLFVAQGFPIRDKDVVYVSASPISDIQRFVGILSSMAFTVIGLGQAVPKL